jgi:hypothetical protein
MVMRLAPASRLFWTSSASAFRGSGWLSASQRMSSKGSCARTLPRMAAQSEAVPRFLRGMAGG